MPRAFVRPAVVVVALLALLIPFLPSSAQLAAQQLTPRSWLPVIDNAPTPTTVPCPRATQEPLWVDPVTSPTDQLSQVITVRIGNGEAVTVTAESGTFAVTGDFNAYYQPALVTANLLPNTTHHLLVSGKVKTINQGSCTYGGYTLNTRTDRNGTPLTIVQVVPTPR